MPPRKFTASAKPPSLLHGSPVKSNGSFAGQKAAATSTASASAPSAPPAKYPPIALPEPVDPIKTESDAVDEAELTRLLSAVVFGSESTALPLFSSITLPSAEWERQVFAALFPNPESTRHLLKDASLLMPPELVPSAAAAVAGSGILGRKRARKDENFERLFDGIKEEEGDDENASLDDEDEDDENVQDEEFEEDDDDDYTRDYFDDGGDEGGYYGRGGGDGGGGDDESYF